MKAKKRKGFTLMEMIIVIAIFSIIMFSMVQVLDPVSKFFVRSSNFENTTACVDNMKRCIEGNLKYADRVRAYNGYKPYVYAGGNSDYSPSATLQTQVKEFYNYYFRNRKFLDTSGYIYVLCFDNTTLVSDAELATASYTTLSSFVDNQRNTGKLVLYQFWFDNYNGIDDPDKVVATLTTACPDGVQRGSVTPWAVNQKLYGPFEYRFSLGSFEGYTTSTVSADPGAPAPADPLPVFNPQDFTINIISTEVRRAPDGGTGLVRQRNTDRNTASFSMKNVLAGNSTAPQPLMDYLTICNDEDLLNHKYTAAERPRFSNMENNPSAVAGDTEFEGFYFIFTLPETTYDVEEAKATSFYGAQSGITT